MESSLENYNFIPKNLMIYISSSHAMEKKLLAWKASEETIRNEPSSPRAQVVRPEGRQRGPRNATRRPAALQIYLAQKTRNLHAIHLCAENITQFNGEYYYQFLKLDNNQPLIFILLYSNSK